MKIRSVIYLGLIGCAMTSWALDNPLLNQDEDALLSAREVAAILAEAVPLPTNSAIIALSRPFKPEGEKAPAWKAVEEDLKLALAKTSVGLERRQELLSIYRTFSTNVAAFAETLSEYRYKRYWALYGLYDTPARPALAPQDFPADLPAEFRLFALALQHYCNDEMPEARERLLELLALPEGSRSLRTFWAKALMAASHAETNPEKALGDFQELRNEIRIRGNQDARLSAFLLRIEARAYSSVTNHAQALNCHFALNLLGQRDLGAMRQTAGLVMLCDEADLDVAARNTAIATFLCWHGATLFSNSRLRTLDETDKEAILRWLAALQKRGLLKTAPEYAAVAAYRAENLELAREAALLAPPTSYLGSWILAKCKLAEHDLAGGVSDLATLYYSVPEMPEEARREVGRELALLYLSSQRYQEALKILLQCRHWQEAAYIAERVLTVKELTSFVRERRRSGEAGVNEEQEARLNYLLARRLMRQMNFAEAAAYFPSLRLGEAAKLVASMARGTNLNLSVRQRGLAWAEAARDFYYKGAPLVATENEPDWFCSDGEGSRPQTSARRNLSRLAPVSAEEQQRLEENSPRLNCHDFCLENAVSQVWKAAEFLPDNSQELSEILREAGAWTENRAGKTARSLYEALINRCPNTELGKQALELHWFPRKQ